jgi:type II secretory pathway pseudopilin PulG
LPTTLREPREHAFARSRPASHFLSSTSGVRSVETRSRSSRFAYSLIELLVIMVIMRIIVVIALPPLF